MAFASLNKGNSGLCAVNTVNLGAPSRLTRSRSFAHLMSRAYFSVWLYLISVSIIVRLMKCAGCIPFAVGLLISLGCSLRLCERL